MRHSYSFYYRSIISELERSRRARVDPNDPHDFGHWDQNQNRK